MKRIGGLFDDATSFASLCEAAHRAAKGKRMNVEAAAFLLELESEVLALQRELRDDSYCPGSYRTFRVREPKPRLISAAPFRDRVVHHAVCAAIDPVFERYAIERSFACRRGKGTVAAVRFAQRLCGRFGWFLKLDVRKYFETIDHAVLRALLRRKLKDARLLDLLDRFIDAGGPGSPPGKGLPIGNLTSQHFANFYLGRLDHWIEQELRAGAYCRYMDDVLLFARDRSALVQARAAVGAFVSRELLLQVKTEKTVLGPVHTGVPFLGFRIWPRLVRLDARGVRRFRTRFRVLARLAEQGTVDESRCIRSGASLCGWAGQADTRGLRRSFFGRLKESGLTRLEM